MNIDDSIVDKIAGLSKLKFEGKSKDKMKDDMNKMIDFVGKLNEVNTEGIEPLIHLTEELNVLRMMCLTVKPPKKKHSKMLRKKTRIIFEYRKC